jgi:large subunit ribosomal protein L31e
MAKKIETKTEKIEKEYIIPLREKCRPVPIYKKTNKAVKTVKEFLVRHMKIRDRDLKKIKIDKQLNEILWSNGIKNPPHKIKVKAIKEKDIVTVKAVNIPEKLKFKKLREEKRENKAEEIAKKKTVKPSEEAPKTEERTTEEKKEEKEKIQAGEEATKQLEKNAAKQIKHQAGGKTKQPKHQIRKALAK